MKTLLAFATTLVASLSISVRAADITVTDGDSFALDGANNVAENRLVFPSEGDATLNLTGVAGSGETVLLAQIVSSGTGAATLATEEGAGKTLRFKNHVSVKGTLTVTGFDLVKAGDTAVTPSTLNAATSLVAPFPAFDVATLASDVTIDGAVQLPQTPAGAGTLTKATTAFLALTGANALGEADAYNLGDYDVMLVSMSAFKKDATVNVAAGRVFGYLPLVLGDGYTWSLSSDTYTSANVNIQLGGTNATTKAVSRVLLWATGNGSNMRFHILNGVVSGVGDVTTEPLCSGSAQLTYLLKGRQSFAGVFKIAQQNSYVSMGVPADGQVPFTFWMEQITSVTFYRTADNKDYGCDDVTVPYMWCEYFNSTINVGENQHVHVTYLNTKSGGGYNIYGVAGKSDKCHFSTDWCVWPGNTRMRIQYCDYVLDENTLAKNTFYTIDSNGTRDIFDRHQETSYAYASGWGVGVLPGGAMTFSSVMAGGVCRVGAGANVQIAALGANAKVEVAAGAHVGIAAQGASSTVAAADGASVSVTQMADGASVTAGNDTSVTIEKLGQNNVVTVGRGAVVSVPDAACDTLTVNQGEDSTTQLYDPEAWKRTVTLWVDASKSETLHSLTNAAGVPDPQPKGTTCGAPQNYEAKAWWYDWRPEQTRYYLYNQRAYHNSSRPQDYPTYQSGLAFVYPWYQPEGGPVAGKGFVHFGPLNGTAAGYASAARLELFDRQSTPAYNSSEIPTAYLVMVYGADSRSNMKGGAGLVTERAGESYPLRRAVDTAQGDISTPMVAAANTTVTVRKNGAAAVSAATATFDEGWQILGLDMTGHGFGGVGYGNNNYGGGQKVAEILLFQSMPTDDDKARIEAYLSKKWNIAVSSSVPSGRPTLAPTINGAGTVSAGGCDLDLRKGSFAGSVNLTDGTVTLRDGTPVPTAVDLPKKDNLLAWFDPNQEESLVLTDIPAATVAAHPGSEQTNEIAWVKDCRGAVAGSYALGDSDSRNHLATSNRRCHLVDGMTAQGEIRHWADQANFYQEFDGSGPYQWGNAFRFYQYDANGVLKTSDHSIDFATAFIVQNSVRGGGVPVLDKFSGSEPYRRYASNPTSPLWKYGVAASLTNGAVHVNGEPVAAPMKASGFTGGPEVLTIETQAGTTFPVKAMGDYGDSEQNTARSGIYGEVLYYGVALTEAERKTVESYLAWKWVGRLLHGYMAYTAVTLDGSASYTAATVGKLPRFATTYTGTVTLQQASYDVTLNGRCEVLAGGFDIPGTVLLPATVTVNVSSAVRIPSGTTVKLASWGTLGSATTFELGTLTGVTPGSRDIVLRAEDDGLYLDVKGKGLKFLLY